MRRFAFVLLANLVLFSRVTWGNEPEDEAEADAEMGEVAKEKQKPAAFHREWLTPYFLAGTSSKGVRAYRSGDYPTASVELTSTLRKVGKESRERQPLRFLLALALMNQSSFQAAGELFESLWTSYPILAPYHAFYAARCRIRVGQIDEALTWLARVPASSVLDAEARMFKVDALMMVGKHAEVESELKQFLTKYPRGPRKPEAQFLLAEVMEKLGRPVLDIAAAFRKVWAEAPLDRFGTQAEERLLALAQASPEKAAQILNRSTEELRSRGLVFFNTNQNTQAETTLQTALARPDLDQATQCNLRYHLAQSVWKQRQRSRAAPLFEKAVATCESAGDRDFTARSLYQGARCFSTAGEKDKAIAYYGRIEKDFSDHRLADDARIRAAEVFVDLKKPEEAQVFLSDLADRYPKGDMGPEALWRMAFFAYQASDWDKAIGYLDELLRRFPREDNFYAEGRAYYFKARALQRKGDRKQARLAYEAAIREYPLSAYALFSFERMRNTFPETRAELVRELRAHPKVKKPTWSFRPNPLWGDPGFLRAVELARLGLGSEARRELARLGIAGGARGVATHPEQQDALWITALLLDQSRLWNASHSIPRYSLASFRRRYPVAGREEAEWKLGFPRAFQEWVTKMSRSAKIPEALTYAIMREESAFYPRAESFANAMGLLQLMTRTAGRFSKTPVSRDLLFDPEKNLAIGTQFLGFLLEHFGGAVPLTISGYNAGEAAVDRWLKERGHLELDEFIETIPFDETRGYTKRVLSSYAAYSWLYSKEKPIPPISFSLKKDDKKNGKKATAKN